MINVAAINPPANIPAPNPLIDKLLPGTASVYAACGMVLVSQLVHALVTISLLPSTVKENGVCPMILSAIIEAVSVPSSVEYSMLAL